ncbi:MAG: hypothetical protein ACPGVU_14490 [Limisphaerales bacterium]
MNEENLEPIDWPLSARGEYLLAAVLIAVIVQLVYFTGSQIANSVDYTAIYEPHFHFLFESLSQGEIPWWNPYVGLGRPMMSDIHFGFYYPPTYFFALGDHLGLFLTLWLHYFLLWWGTRGLARELGASRLLSFIAGIVIVLSGNYSGRMLSGMLYFVFQECYAPLIFWLTIRLGRRWEWRQVVPLSVAVFFMFLCGNGHVFWIIMLGAGVFLVARLAFEYRELTRKEAGVVVGQFAAAVALFVGLSTFAWLPYLDLVANSNRSEPAYEFATFMSAAPNLLLTMVARPGEFRVDWEYLFFVGCLWFLAALPGTVGSRDSRMRALGVVILFAIIFALGAHTPIFKLFYHLLPGTKLFRVPSRIMVLATVAVIVAGAVFLSRRERGHERWIAGGAVMVGVWFVASMMSEPGRAFRPHGSAVIMLVLAVLLLIALPRVRPLQHWPVVIVLIGGLSLTELIPLNLWMKRVYIPPNDISPSANPNVENVARMKADMALPENAPPPRANIDPELFQRNSGMMIGVADVTADAPLFLGRPWRFIHAITGLPMDPLLNNSLPFDLGRLSPAALRFVSLDIGLDPQKNEMVAVPDPFPRAYFTTRMAFVPNEREAIESLLSMPPGPIAVIESEPPAHVQMDEFFKIPITHFENNRIEVSFTNQHHGYLVLNEAWFPGWTATRGAETIPASPVNAWMRGFLVPPGNEPVVIEFRPRHLAAGIMVSLGALGLTLFLFLGKPHTHKDGGDTNPKS